MKYEVLLVGHRIEEKMGARHVEAHVDSMLVTGYINGTYDARYATMALYLEQAKLLIRSFDSCTVIHIKWSQNKPADELSKMGYTVFELMGKEVCIKVLDKPSIP